MTEQVENQVVETTETAEAQEPKHNISAVARAAILEGKSNAEALEIVKGEFPEARTTVASIAWYRNDLRKKGHDVKSPARVKKEKPAKAETAEDAKTEVKASPKKAAQVKSDKAETKTETAGADDFE